MTNVLKFDFKFDCRKTERKIPSQTQQMTNVLKFDKKPKPSK